MSNKGIRVESPSTARAWLQGFIVVVLISSIVVSSHRASGDLTTDHFIKVRGCFWARSALVFRFFLLFNVPLFLACFNVDFQALSTEFTAADITHEHFWSQGAWRFLNWILAVAAAFAHFLVLDQCFRVECSIAAITLLQNFILKLF